MTVEGVLRMAARAHESRTQTSVRCDISNLPDQAPRQIKVCLYRLVQEGLTNIRKHASASRVSVKLAAAFPNIILRIEDNGQGIARPTDGESPKRGLGLVGISERARLLGARHEMLSAPGKGTRLTIRLTVQESENGH